MNSLNLLLLILLIVSCGKSKKSELVTFNVNEMTYLNIINNKAMPLSPDLNSDKVIVNKEYPFEIAFYNDGKWYYNLPNLDVGSGTWKYDQGKLKLHASRRLFDMNIDVVSLDDLGKSIAIKFNDRHGPKVLSMESHNLD